MNRIKDQIIQKFKEGSLLIKLIYINLAVFVLVRLTMGIITIGGGYPDVILNWLALPADYDRLITRPWTIFSYMFLHYSFFHILFNLIALYWLGQIFMSYLGEKKLLSVYLLGGLSGAAIYFISYNVFDGLELVNSKAMVLGASGAVFSIMVAIAFIAPRHKVYLPFISLIELKWIVLIFLGLDLLSLPGSNTGGHIAHLGGAIFGWLYATQHRKGNNIASWFEKLIKNLEDFIKSFSKAKVSYTSTQGRKKRPETDIEYNARKKAEQDEINKILDKVAESGYESLSRREKEILFKNSNKR